MIKLMQPSLQVLKLIFNSERSHVCVLIATAGTLLLVSFSVPGIGIFRLLLFPRNEP